MNHRGWRTQTIDITFPRSEVEGRAQARDRPHLRRGRSARSTKATAARAVGSRDRPRPRARQRAARVRRRAPSSRAATRSARGSASCSRPAKRARCITTACSSATAPMRSTRTSRSRRSGSRATTGCSTRTHDVGRRLPPGGRQGHAQGDGEDGHLDAAVLQGRADLRGARPRRRRDRPLLRRHREPDSGRELRRARGGDAAPPRARLSRSIRDDKLPSLPNPGEFHWRSTGETPRLGPAGDLLAAGRGAPRRSATRIATSPTHVNEEARENGALRGLLEFKPAASRDPARRGRAGQRDRQAVLHRRDELRLDLGRGARDARDRDEPHRRQEQHRRRRRGPGAVRAAAERRLAAVGDQAGRLRPLRRHDLVSRERRRAADQDGAGREARRGRRAARPQGRRQHRADSLFDAGRGLDQPAAAPRHLLDRGSRAADPRLEEREPVGARQREARVRGRRRHDRGRRREGARGPHADFRRQRRHRRFAAHEHQARGPAVGARHRRDAPDARA